MLHVPCESYHIIISFDSYLATYWTIADMCFCQVDPHVHCWTDIMQLRFICHENLLELRPVTLPSPQSVGGGLLQLFVNVCTSMCKFAG